MASSLTIDDLSTDDVVAAEEFLVTFLSNSFPSLDLSEGSVLRTTLVRPAAIFHTLNRTDIDNLRKSMSMIAIEENPALASDEVVDGILSNFRLTRDAGEKATGQIGVVIRNLSTTPIGQGTVFTSNGLKFTTLAAYVGVTTAEAVVSSSQRLIVKRNDDFYVFTIPVVAEDVGDEYRVKKNTKFTASSTITGLVDLYATQDFTGGRKAQTNSEMVSLFKTAITSKVFSGRSSIESMVREAWADTKAVSIIGFGDPEMLRDRHNIFNLSHGGKADLYVRTQSLPEQIKVSKTATLINKDSKKWQLAINKDDAPGFYTIDSVLLSTAAPDQGTFEITNEVRNINLEEDDNVFVPDIDNLIEGGFSSYQTAVVQFIDTGTDVSALTENVSTATYDVYLTYMPGIKDLQTLAKNRTARNPQADYLVRAPIPAFVTMSLLVQYKDGSTAPDVSDIKLAVVERVNGLNFNLGRLPASVIHDAVHDIISKSEALVVSPIDILCRIHQPNGTIIFTRSENQIVIPDDPANCVTSRTTVFYLDISGIDITLTSVPVLPV